MESSDQMLGGGSSISGDFFNVDLGFLVQNRLGRVKDTMVAGNVYTALKHVVALRRCRMERILLHSVCDCGGTIHYRKAN